MTFIHNLENNYSKLIIKKQNNPITNKTELINNSLLSPLNPYKITSLTISNCNLCDIPEWFTFNNLTELDISRNLFQQVPHLIYINLKLQSLDLSYNRINNFNKRPKCDVSLVYLNLSHNQLESIPCWICSINCDDLQTLKLNNNPIQYKPLKGRYLKQLKLLDLSNTKFRPIKNNFLSEIPKLDKLYLSNNTSYDTNFIEELDFHNYAFVLYIRELHLSGLGLSEIPDDFVVLKNLEYLNLRKNYISWLPKNFTKLSCLKVLIVSENELSHLPSDIDNLVLLEQLLIANNSVASLPPTIKKLKHLKTLDLYNNDFQENICYMEGLTELDLELNLFDLETDEIYLKQRDTLRLAHGFWDRINGPKKYDDGEDHIPRMFKDDFDRCSSDSGQSVLHECVEEGEAENWETESLISDDMELVIPKFRYFLKTKNIKPDPRSFVDPRCFEDADF